jgi:glycosyltransferase involved in cell wall biosynthesis
VAKLSRERALRLVIIGTGRDEAELRRLAMGLGIADRVEFTGFLPDPTEHLQQADVFVLATDHEGFGNVLVEALGAGLPVVVSDVPYGPRFILDNGRYGTLVKHESIGELAHALGAALDRTPLDDEADARLRARAGSFAVEQVAERFQQLVDLVQAGARAVPAEYRVWA